MRISVLCHDIRSIHNIGSIFRTADAALVEKIYLCGITPSPRDRFGRIRVDFAKVSLGAEDSVAFESAKATEEVIRKLKANGWQILVLEQSERSVSYDKIPKPDVRDPKICLVLGNEVKGSSPSILELADYVVEIPMRGRMVRDAKHPRNSGRGKESLNVAVAFGIAMFEIAKHS